MTKDHGMNTEYVDIPGYDGKYKANKLGEIIRMYGNGKTRALAGYLKRMGRRTRRNGYRLVRVVKLDGKEHHWATVIADTFMRARAKGESVYHKNGITSDNRLENLGIASRSELALKANNCFGMKCSLSGNDWPGSTWDGKSKYTKQTGEQKSNGEYYTITADFRKYGSVADSIADHSAYLLGAKNGSKLRYAGLKGCTDYKKAFQIIKDGGYATAIDYVSKLCKIVEKWDLTKFDVSVGSDKEAEKTVYYRVRKDWSKPDTQIGAFTVLKNAKNCVNQNPGYKVFDEDGKQAYPEKSDIQKQAADKAVESVPFKVKVSVPDLNIRTGAGTNFSKTGKCTGKGVFTIVETKEGAGSKNGWGLLKSGAGWISLDYCTKL